MSPVRSMPMRANSPFHSASISTPKPSGLSISSTPKAHSNIWTLARRHEFELRAAVFILKVMSIQPVFFGVDKPPMVVLGLVLLALYDLKGRSWVSFAAATAAHIAILYAAV